MSKSGSSGSHPAKLRVQHLTKRYEGAETIAVDDLSFELSDGEILSLLGPSGCGKTTTLRCVAGVELVTDGTIEIDGQIVSSKDHVIRPQHRNLGMVYQNYAIWPHKTVYGNVLFPLKHANHDFSPDEYEERVESVLELVQIPELKDKPATDLSGGQQQRTALARALVTDPHLLLLDEPLSNLDRKLRIEMRDLIQRLQHELGVSILYVTHDQEEAFYLSDRVIVMREGKLVEEGAPTDLYSLPDSPFTRDFVGQWNKIPATINGRTVTIEIGNSPVEIDLSDIGHVFVDVDDTSGPTRGTVFIRPTSVRLSPGDDGAISIDGTVVAGGVLGELYEFTVDTGSRMITSQVTEHLDLPRGEDVTVSIQREELQLYPEGV